MNDYLPGMRVVHPGKQFKLPCPRTDPLEKRIHLVGLSARLSHLGHDHIRVYIPIHQRISFYPNQAMLFAVVQPVSRSPRPYDPLKLIRLHPYDLFHALVPPKI